MRKTLEAAVNRSAFSEVSFESAVCINSKENHTNSCQIHLSFHPDSFNSMRELSMITKLSQYVKTVLFDGSVLTYDQLREDWEDCLRLPDSCQLPAHPQMPTGIITLRQKEVYQQRVKDWLESCTTKNFLHTTTTGIRMGKVQEIMSRSERFHLNPRGYSYSRCLVCPIYKPQQNRDFHQR